MDWFINNIKNKVPFAYARFNDGEMMAIDQVGSVVARGDQYVDASLSAALLNAIKHKQKNYYIGVPCSLCYPRYNKLANELIGDYELKTLAVVTTNRNWKNFVDTFPAAMQDRKMIWIGGNDQNIDAIKDLGIDIKKAARLPRQNSWDYYRAIYSTMPQYFEPGDVVGISLGPLARILARQWFEQNPEVTFVDMGSNFDPFTRNVRHNCHKGWEQTGFNLAKPCKECN
tara:strand:+ start:1311 stop:1994 length:684 start_codon:yes stop_codon:yes gene_type:complete